MKKPSFGSVVRLKNLVYLKSLYMKRKQEKLYKPEGKECLPLGITKLMHIFNQRYTINGCQKLITETLRSCTGSCKLKKCLNTASPPPQPVITKYVMERIQIDLLQMYGPKALYVPSLATIIAL